MRRRRPRASARNDDWPRTRQIKPKAGSGPWCGDVESPRGPLDCASGAGIRASSCVSGCSAGMSVSRMASSDARAEEGPRGGRAACLLSTRAQVDRASLRADHECQQSTPFATNAPDASCWHLVGTRRREAIASHSPGGPAGPGLPGKFPVAAPLQFEGGATNQGPGAAPPAPVRAKASPHVWT
jgi:hypothetical protein